ncbi:MAG: hypothetical protein ACTHMM_16730 [Agriterribacter sp.]
MIDPKELRVGNWVLCIYEDKSEYPVKVVAITEEGFTTRGDEVYPHKDDELEGISLTPEILENCGFEYNGDHFFKDEVCLFKLGNSGIHFLYDYTGKEIKYFHQLQNLYFALTGKELEVNL